MAGEENLLTKIIFIEIVHFTQSWLNVSHIAEEKKHINYNTALNI